MATVILFAMQFPRPLPLPPRIIGIDLWPASKESATRFSKFSQPRPPFLEKTMSFRSRKKYRFLNSPVEKDMQRYIYSKVRGQASLRMRLEITSDNRRNKARKKFRITNGDDILIEQTHLLNYE